MNMESEQPQFYPLPSSQFHHGTKRTHSGSRRMPQTAAHLPEPEAASPSPLASSQTPITQEVIGHIYGLRHLDDQHILELLRVARHPVTDRSSVATFSTLSSRASSYRVPSLYSDPRSSVASDVSVNCLTPASRLSQAPSITSCNKYECTECNVKLKSKQYWKSHEEEFHEQERMWKCPDCERWFNAGKRFREHHFKHHGCDVCEQPKEKGNGSSRIPSPCVTAAEKIKHHKDAWGCGFCVRLLGSWDERCTHVAQHFDEGKTKADWDFTNVILGLLLQPELSNEWHSFLFRKYGELSEEWPKFTWDQKKSRSLRFSLEEKWDTRVLDTNTRQHLTVLIQKLHDLGSPVPSNLGIQIMHTDTKVLPESFQEVAMGQSKGTTVLPSHTVPQQEFQQPAWGIPSQSASKSTPTEHNLQDFTFMDTTGSHPLPTEFSPESIFTEGFPHDPNDVTFPHIVPYMNYTTNHYVEEPPHFESHIGFSKPVVSPFLATSSPSSLQRKTPKLVSIPSRPEPPHRKPPPPPPKDAESSHPGVRRLSENTSRHVAVSASWQNEESWV